MLKESNPLRLNTRQRTPKDALIQTAAAIAPHIVYLAVMTGLSVASIKTLQSSRRAFGDGRNNGLPIDPDVSSQVNGAHPIQTERYFRDTDISGGSIKDNNIISLPDFLPPQKRRGVNSMQRAYAFADDSTGGGGKRFFGWFRRNDDDGVDSQAESNPDYIAIDPDDGVASTC